MQQSTTGNIVSEAREPAAVDTNNDNTHFMRRVIQSNHTLGDIFYKVIQTTKYNFAQARMPVPSALNIPQWREWLIVYTDRAIVDYLEYGWPVNFDRRSPLVVTYHNHPLPDQFPGDVEHYIHTELGHGALLGPFKEPPMGLRHLSPLITQPKRDARFRRVIMDLSWPKEAAVNNGIDHERYIDVPAHITLPTADYTADRLLQLGDGAYLYKTDLARGYRQLRVDPADWGLLGFSHAGLYYVDICPPFGLRSSAMFMQRTSEAIVHIHATQGFHSKPYLDDFGGADSSLDRATQTLTTLQRIMAELGVVEAQHKTHRPAQQIVWLGIFYDTVAMTMTIPATKVEEIMVELGEWEGRKRATRQQLQRLIGLLQFVASVSPPVRIFSNRMLQCLRKTPDRGSHGLSLGFRKDLKFFLDLLPVFNGIRIIRKQDLPYQEEVELDACLTGCGATIGTQYYAEEFPEQVQSQGHIIARLELLNIVVTLKVWGECWNGQRVKIFCDNSIACLSVQSGRSRDDYIQHCVREIFLPVARYDVELVAAHRPGEKMTRADALSRMHAGATHRQWVQADPALSAATRVRVTPAMFDLMSDL